MKSTIFGVAFLTILTAPVVPAQTIVCVEGEPKLGEIQPDVNLTVRPSLTINPLSNISVVCNAGPPRLPTSPAPANNLPPVSIMIEIGDFQVKECINTSQCVYDLETFFPTLPRNIRCTAANENAECRYKVASIALTGETTTAAPTTAAPTTQPRTTATVGTTALPPTPPVPTRVTTKKKDDSDDDSDDESDDDTDETDSD